MGAALRQSGKGSTGFVAVGPEWPSTYYHREMESLLVVQVDDLKMAGPQSMLRSKLDLEPETDLGLCPIREGNNQAKGWCASIHQSLHMTWKVSLTRHPKISRNCWEGCCSKESANSISSRGSQGPSSTVSLWRRASQSMWNGADEIQVSSHQH